jgi:DNA-binding MarR family transcriptional regulator
MQHRKIRRPVDARRAKGPIPHLGSLEEFIPYKLSVVANRVSQSIGRLFDARFNLQIPEWRILMALFAYGDLAFFDVVERTSMDKARVSRAQRRLIDLGLISAAPDPEDGRCVILTLTKKGSAVCVAIAPEARRMEAWFLEVLNAGERRELDLILDKLFARSQELSRDAAAPLQVAKEDVGRG